jgi:hypothetical protein
MSKNKGSWGIDKKRSREEKREARRVARLERRGLKKDQQKTDEPKS